MLSINQFKFFLVFALFACQACGFWQSGTDTNSASSLFSTEETKSEIPFSTKEPDVYQAEIVLINYNNGEKQERKIFVARNGEKLRYDYESKISFLQLSTGEKFSIHTGKKIYVESRADAGSPAPQSENVQDFLSSEWLNTKAEARFENLGAENGLIKYRVVLADSQASEVLIYVDENYKIPVKQEFYSTNGERKNLVFAMEVRNLKLQTDENLFQLPMDYKKVSSAEFQKLIWQEKFDSKNE